MDPTPPTESAGASRAQPLTHDQRVTNFLRWFTTACTAVGTATVLWIAAQFMQTRDNQFRLGIIVDNLSARVARVEDDNDKDRVDYQKLLERQQMHHLAIQQIQSHLKLR
jgi:hypothetical protein